MATTKNAETGNADAVVVEVSEELLRDKLYEVRGVKVMLDSDLAEIYGYETKNFNRQVKNNAKKFEGDEFMFKLSKAEYDQILRCKNFTSSWGGTRHEPYAFTEQGIYMLMTVLRGDLAIKQSRALVSTFKKMKDYIYNNQNLFEQRELVRLSIQTSKNKNDIGLLHMNMGAIEKQMSDVMGQLNDVVTKSELSDLMNGFVNDDNGWLMYNSQYCSADVAFSSVYGQAKRSIYLIDNYIGLRTLVLLKNASEGIDIKIFSDNLGHGKLHYLEYDDFCKEYPNIKVTLQHTGGRIHDRFIVLDYGTEDERFFLCGASSRDAGARITSIVEDFGTEKYHPLVDQIAKNGKLKLP